MKTREELLKEMKRFRREMLTPEQSKIVKLGVDDILNTPTQAQFNCPYCHGHEFIVEGFDLNANIYRNELFVRSKDEITTNYIKYCPMCGRNLGDE